MRSRKTTIAGFLTMLTSLAVAYLTGDYSSIGPALATGLGLIAAQDH